VEVERLGSAGNKETHRVTEAEVVFVAVDESGQPTPLQPPA